MDTWGIPGPEFLRLYVVVVAAPVVLGLLWRLAQSARTAQHRPRELTVYHLAYLAGGKRRVGEAAVARLLDQRRLRIGTTGKITVVKGSKVTDKVTDKVEGVVIGAANRAKLPKIISKLDPVVGALNADLAAAGLAVPEAQVRLRKRTVAVLSLLATLLGVARFLAGVINDRPVGWLFLELVGAVVVTIVVFRLRRADPALPTWAGRRVLAEAKTAGRSGDTASADRVAMVVSGAGLAGAVALGGIALYPDRAVQAALAYVPATSGGGGGSDSSGGSCSGGSSCSSGSSCGGGGCGGGGCGG